MRPGKHLAPQGFCRRTWTEWCTICHYPRVGWTAWKAQVGPGRGSARNQIFLEGTAGHDGDGCGLACQNHLQIFTDQWFRSETCLTKTGRAHKAELGRVSLVTSTQHEPTKNKMRGMSVSMGSLSLDGVSGKILGEYGFVAWPNQCLLKWI